MRSDKVLFSKEVTLYFKEMQKMIKGDTITVWEPVPKKGKNRTITTWYFKIDGNKTIKGVHSIGYLFKTDAIKARQAFIQRLDHIANNLPENTSVVDVYI